MSEASSSGDDSPKTKALAARLWGHAKPDSAGLVAVVVIDRDGGDLRMVGYMNRDALEATLERRRVVFFSRSKQRLWEKGESSGNVLRLHEIRIDCDGDAIACYVDAVGPTCHTGARSCFFRRVEGEDLRFDDGPAPATALQAEEPASASHAIARVFGVIEDRKAGRGMTNRDDKSYVRSLLDKGTPKINSKIAEEAMELCAALRSEDDESVAKEAADLFFHAMVGLSHRGLGLAQVEAVFDARFGVSGIDEKASRDEKTKG
jgi:phosphoribosyl-ATP pyrophosphohydrolase/phosphoribosyl-AMP cyclohydrolase